VRILAFSTGRVRQKRGNRGIRRYFVDEWKHETLPVNVFLVEHPEGLCLVDTGQRAAAAQPGYYPAWYPFFRLSRFELSPEDEAASQLRRAGYDVSRIRWIVLTHLHTDHVGGLGAFAGADVLVPRTEWEIARGLGGRLRGYLPKEWPDGLQPRLIDFDGRPIGPFPGSYDIAADGRLLIVPLPGHTRGHAALLARDAGSSWLCAGDAAFGPEDFAAAAPSVHEWCKREDVSVLLAHDPSATGGTS
jgi:glyoxylase-like metal-dependent hydrolase (beta-lactamase superfamily II)